MPQRDRSPWTWLPSATGVLLAAFLFWGFLRPVDWDDLGWHIRVGNWILEHGVLPERNVLVWTTPEHPFVPHEWLSEVVFALLDRAGGMRLLLVVRALAFTLTLWLLVSTGRRAGAEPLALAALTFVAGWGLATQGTLRPWLFSNLLLVTLLWLLDRAEREGRSRLLWWLPPLFVLWANLHGGFVVGLGVLGLRSFDRVLAAPRGARAEAAKSAGVVVGAATVASAITPLGPSHILFPLRYLFATEDGSGIRIMKGSIVEWLPIRLDTIEGGVLIAQGAALLAVVALTAGRRDARAWLALALLAMSLREQRHLATATAIGFGPICAWLLAPLAVRMRGAQSGLLSRLAAHSRIEAIPRGGLAILVAILAATSFATYRRGPDFERAVTAPDRYPLDAMAALASLSPQRAFHYYEYCGPLAWKEPSVKLFVVGIHDAQPESLFSDYLRIVHRLDGWPETLARWAPDAALLPSEHPLVANLEERGWTRRFSDAFAAVLVPPPVSGSR